MLHLDLNLMEESLDSFLLEAVPVKEQGLVPLTVKVFSAASCWLVHPESLNPVVAERTSYTNRTSSPHREMFKTRGGIPE